MNNAIHNAIASRFNLDVSNEDWQSICCPLHKEEKASAGINFGLSVFNCFGCKEKMKLYTLANRLELVTSEVEEFVDSNNLKELGYLKTTKTVKIKEQVKELSDFYIEKGLLPETVEDWLGEYIYNPDDYHYGYLKFPLDKGYVARKISPFVAGERFDNSKGSRTLFGKKNIYNNDQIVLVEGLTDFLTLHQMGYKNCVCSLGSQLSKEQAYLLRNKLVFIIYDKDFAGYEGAKQAQQTLKDYGSTGIIVELPDNGQDKNDINMMYVQDSSYLNQFLEKELTRHSTYDTNFLNLLSRKNGTAIRYRSNIVDFDTVLNGGFTNGVYGFVGEPGIGKSTLITTLVDTFIEQGARVLDCSYELSKEQKWARLASRHSKYSWVELEQDFSLVEPNVLKKLHYISSNLRIDVGTTIHDIKASVKNFDVVVVDYIQRMPAPFDGMDKRTSINTNSEILSDIMAKYNKTIILISSMPRSQYGSEQGTSLFKESGDIEYTAQGVFYMAKLGIDKIRIDVRKNTRGAVGSIIVCNSDWQHQRLTSGNIMDGEI